MKPGDEVRIVRNGHVLYLGIFYAQTSPTQVAVRSAERLGSIGLFAIESVEKV